MRKRSRRRGEDGGISTGRSDDAKESKGKLEEDILIENCQFENKWFGSKIW
jgi:hypothetical protein